MRPQWPVSSIGAESKVGAFLTAAERCMFVQSLLSFASTPPSARRRMPQKRRWSIIRSPTAGPQSVLVGRGAELSGSANLAPDVVYRIAHQIHPVHNRVRSGAKSWVRINAAHAAADSLADDPAPLKTMLIAELTHNAVMLTWLREPASHAEGESQAPIALRPAVECQELNWAATIRTST